MIFHLLAFTLMLAAADRICGGPRIIPKLGQLSIINDVWVPFAIMGGTWMITENAWATVGLGLAFAAWRSLGWKVFGGSIDPTSGKEIRGTFLRHLLAMPLAIVLWPFVSPPYAIAVPIIFAGIATGLASINGQSVAKGRDLSAEVEILRGAFLGLLVGIALS